MESPASSYGNKCTKRYFRRERRSGLVFSRRRWRNRSSAAFGGEADHVHLLVEIHPALNISVLINNLKSASSRRIRNRFADHLKKFYGKPVFWHRAYFVASVGNVTLETVRRYVEQQGTKEKPRKKLKQNRPA
ncbi:MAG: IS200/IS605 family transposase [Desulfobacca sp.]|nr:IS200/IS605 family transposase [Desulfobacca sp.]